MRETITMKFNYIHLFILAVVFFLNACKSQKVILPETSKDVTEKNDIISDSTTVKKANLQIKQSSEKIESNSLSKPTPKSTGEKPKKK